jgi:hypothetical protein
MDKIYFFLHLLNNKHIDKQMFIISLTNMMKKKMIFLFVVRNFFVNLHAENRGLFKYVIWLSVELFF